MLTTLAANSQGCIAVVRHLKIEDKVEIVNAFGKTRTEEFIAMNPCHTCPTLQFDGDDGAIWESCAIMRWLCVNNKGGEELYPSDPILRGKIDMVMDWRQTGMYSCIPAIAYSKYRFRLHIMCSVLYICSHLFNLCDMQLYLVCLKKILRQRSHLPN